MNSTRATTSTRKGPQSVCQPITTTILVATSPGMAVAASPGMERAAGWLAGRVSADHHPAGRFAQP